MINVTKPFSPRELVARINVILKRSQQTYTKQHGDYPGELRLSKLTIQPQQHTACWQGQNVTLTATEFAMLHLFARQPTRV